MELKNIKNFLFDLGGVIIDIDIPLTIKALQSKLPSTAQDTVSAFFQSDLHDRYERGYISSGEFREELRTLGLAGLTDEDIDALWNTLLLDIPRERVALLQSLAENHALYMLSNTNPIHFIEVERRLAENHSINGFKDIFTHLFLSYEMGMRKPEASIYQTVAQQASILPEETLFIDDMLVNIEAAAAIGYQVFHLENPSQLAQLIRYARS